MTGCSGNGWRTAGRRQIRNLASSLVRAPFETVIGAIIAEIITRRNLSNVPGMPLLRKESDLHPEDLFDLPAQTHPWWVAHVRSRREKMLVRGLLQHDIAFYLPQVEQRIRRNGRTFVSFLPLFPGYVFVRGSRPAHDAIWRSETAASVIEVPDQAGLAAELAQIHALQRSGAMLRPWNDLVPGDPVRITEGAFKGYSGVLTGLRGGERLIVAVSLLHKAVVVEFSRDVVAPGARATR